MQWFSRSLKDPYIPPPKKTHKITIWKLFSATIEFAQDTDVFDDIRALVERVHVAVTNIEPQSGV